jgi:hypothetical protein
MKLLALLFLTLFVGKGCSNTDDLKNTRIEYTAISRGYYQQIVVSNQGMVVQTGREGSEKKTISISEKEWKALVANFQTIELEQVAAFKAPTQKRFWDGAALAHVKFTVNEKEYQSADFDHGFPPAEMEKLINKLVALANQK